MLLPLLLCIYMPASIKNTGLSSSGQRAWHFTRSSAIIGIAIEYRMRKTEKVGSLIISTLLRSTSASVADGPMG